MKQSPYTHTPHTPPPQPQPAKKTPYLVIGLIIGVLLILTIVFQYGGYITARVIDLGSSFLNVDSP